MPTPEPIPPISWNEKTPEQRRISKALAIAARWSLNGDEEQKTWAIDQMVRALTLDYQRFLTMAQEPQTHSTCRDCGRDCSDEMYMIHEHLWLQYAGGEGCLCVGCIERRIGRILGPQDFCYCLMNYNAVISDEERAKDRILLLHLANGFLAPASLADVKYYYSARLLDRLQRWYRSRYYRPAECGDPCPCRRPVFINQSGSS